MKETEEKHAHHQSHHKPADTSSVVEAEIKRKGLTPKTDASEISQFTPLSLDDQKLLHSTYPDGWKGVNETLRKHKEEARDRQTKIEQEKHEEELKQLKVKRYDEPKPKPEFLCVVNGCGEEKAPGQGYHCAVHSKGS